MAATGKTPILLYGSTTATNQPSAGNLTNSSDGCEIAINVTDKNLFFKDNTNTVNTVPIRQSSASSNGWLSSTDWSTFNSKQSALVSGTNIKTVSGTSLLGSGDLGTIGVGYGGTGTSTAFTAGSLVFAGASGVYSQNNAKIFWDNSNYRLGIGTASPSAPLHVTSSDNQTLLNIVSAGTGSLIWQSYGTAQYMWNGGGALQFGTSGNYNLSLAANGSTAQTIFPSGGVSIGNTTDPGAGNLSVNNNLLVGTTILTPNDGVTNGGLTVKRTADCYVSIGHASGTSSGAYFIGFSYNGTNIGSVTQNGTTQVLYNQSSDYRLKNNIELLNNSGTFIDSLIPRTWTWNDGTKGVGFIAHEFQQICPSAVTGEKDQVNTDGEPIYQGMQASAPEVMANIVLELQQLRKRVAELEGNIK